jgi:hypothetical protein
MNLIVNWNDCSPTDDEQRKRLGLCIDSGLKGDHKIHNQDKIHTQFFSHQRMNSDEFLAQLHMQLH